MTAVIWQLGELPLHAHVIISLLSFWHRASQMPENSLARQDNHRAMLRIQNGLQRSNF